MLLLDSADELLAHGWEEAGVGEPRQQVGSSQCSQQLAIRQHRLHRFHSITLHPLDERVGRSQSELTMGGSESQADGSRHEGGLVARRLDQLNLIRIAQSRLEAVGPDGQQNGRLAYREQLRETGKKANKVE